MIRFADPSPRQSEGLSDGKINNIIINNNNNNNNCIQKKQGAVSKATVTQEELKNKTISHNN